MGLVGMVAKSVIRGRCFVVTEPRQNRAESGNLEEFSATTSRRDSNLSIFYNLCFVFDFVGRSE